MLYKGKMAVVSLTNKFIVKIILTASSFTEKKKKKKKVFDYLWVFKVRFMNFEGRVFKRRVETSSIMLQTKRNLLNQNKDTNFLQLV